MDTDSVLRKRKWLWCPLPDSGLCYPWCMGSGSMLKLMYQYSGNVPNITIFSLELEMWIQKPKCMADVHEAQHLNYWYKILWPLPHMYHNDWEGVNA